MERRRLRILGIVFGVVLLVVGLGVAVSPQRLLSLCRTDCWLNGLLLAVTGDHWGKFVLGALWYLGGVAFIYIGVFGWKRGQRGS